MDTDRHGFLLTTEGTEDHGIKTRFCFLCFPCFPWLEYSSAFRTHNSELGKAAWEIK